MLEITEADLDEVIAIRIGDEVYLGELAIDKVKEHKHVTCVYSRGVFKLLVELDLDSKWAEYAKYPTLFKMSELNEFTNKV